MTAFEVSFSIRKKFYKKKVSREIAFALIGLFHVKIFHVIFHVKSRSTTTKAFVFLAEFTEFYYHKIFETRS